MAGGGGWVGVRGPGEPGHLGLRPAMEKGDLKFTLHGKKLKGSWVLVRTRGFGGGSKPSWLMIKHRDQYASTEDITETQPRSAVSRRFLACIARDNGGNAEVAATGDPVSKTSPRRIPPKLGKRAPQATPRKRRA